MKKLLVGIVSTVVSTIGWALGAKFGIMTAFILSMIGLGVGIYYLARPPPEKIDVSPLVPPDPQEKPPPSDSYMGVYWDAAVATNGAPCSIIGR